MSIVLLVLRKVSYLFLSDYGKFNLEKEGDEMVSRLFDLTKVVFFCFLILMPLSSLAQEKPFLNVDQLVDEALQNNPEILAAKKKWEVVRERIPQAYALEDPMFGFGIINLPTSFSFREEDMTMKEFSISQRFPFPGKRPLRKEIAEKEADAVFTEIQGKIHQIIRDVKTAYYDLSHIYQTTEVTQRNKEILENFAKIAETKYSVGEGVQQDVLKAHIEVSKMVDELIMLGQRRRALEAKLNALLNRPPETPAGEPEEVIFRKFPFTVEELQKMALEMNPTLKGMKKMIEAKEKAYALAKKEYYPDFNFRFAYGQRENLVDMKQRDMLTGMMEINIPIFYKSKQDRKVAETKADIMVTEAQYRAMKNEIFFMITDMGSMIQREERKLELYKTGIIPQVSLQVNSAMSSYRVNKVDFLTLLDSQMTLFKYELEYHLALTEYEKNVASLGAVIGKRFSPKEEGK
jgi:cobalt-zinc-cadmium efflux system outer membrane protein